MNLIQLLVQIQLNYFFLYYNKLESILANRHYLRFCGKKGKIYLIMSPNFLFLNISQEKLFHYLMQIVMYQHILILNLYT